MDNFTWRTCFATHLQHEQASMSPLLDYSIARSSVRFLGAFQTHSVNPLFCFPGCPNDFPALELSFRHWEQSVR